MGTAQASAVRARKTAKMKIFSSVREALEKAADMAIHQRVQVSGRNAEVVYGADGKTIRFTTTHTQTTQRPGDGRKYNKGSEVSKQYGESS